MSYSILIKELSVHFQSVMQKVQYLAHMVRWMFPKCVHNDPWVVSYVQLVKNGSSKVIQGSCGAIVCKFAKCFVSLRKQWMFLKFESNILILYLMHSCGLQVFFKVKGDLGMFCGANVIKHSLLLPQTFVNFFGTRLLLLLSRRVFVVPGKFEVKGHVRIIWGQSITVSLCTHSCGPWLELN